MGLASAEDRVDADGLFQALMRFYDYLTGLPPLLIHVGSDEILLSDAESLAERADAAGVAVRLKQFEGMWHEFHAHASTVPGATETVGEVGAFLRG